MTERTEVLRLGLGVRDAMEFWATQGDRLTGARVSRRSGAENHIFEWGRHDGMGRAELIDDQGSTLLRLTLEGEDPDSALNQILKQLSDALDEVGGVDPPSFKLEPYAEAPPDAATSDDQPL